MPIGADSVPNLRLADNVADFCSTRSAGTTAEGCHTSCDALMRSAAELGERSLEVPDRLLGAVLVLDHGEAHVPVAAGPETDAR